MWQTISALFARLSAFLGAVMVGGDMNYYGGGMSIGGGDGMGGGAAAANPVLSNLLWVILIMVGVAVVAGVLGWLLARKRIKKGFDSYEDN